MASKCIRYTARQTICETCNSNVSTDTANKIYAFDISVLNSRLHVILTFFLVKLSLLFSSRILILLVLRHKIIHVALSFCKLHLIHTFPRVPMQERLPAKHSG